MTAALTISVGLSTGLAYTSNGGATFTRLGSTPAVVPTRQPSTMMLAGYPDGTLTSLGSVLYTFPSAISAVLVNEANAARFTVGLANGDVWRSIDAGATWVYEYTFGAQVTQLIESTDGQITYVAAANIIWATYRAFLDTPQVWYAFAAGVFATQTLVNGFGNYVGSATGLVINVDTGAVLAGPTTPILGLAFNPRQATLWVLEQNGRFWRMPTGGSTLTNLSTLAGGGGVLVPVSPSPGLILSANTLGAWVSPDAGVTWKRILAGIASSIGWYSPSVPGTF